MTLEGANNFNENENSTIYTLNNPQIGQYALIIPKNLNNEISMIVDLNMKDSFDSLIKNSITKDTLIQKLNDEYKNINSKYPSGILVLPMLDINELTNYINSGDKQKLFDETKKIGSITSEVYNKLNNAGIDKSKINQKIIILEKTEIDNKFVAWLKEQMPNFVDGESLNELISNQSIASSETNPFQMNNPTTENIPNPVTNDIFGAPTTQEPTPNPEPENSLNSEIIPNNDLFPSQPESTEAPQSPFDTSSNQEPSTETKQNMEEDIQPNPEPNFESVETSDTPELDKKTGGFANLLILLVILVVVTFVSIELGKMLYNTFGA